MDPSSRLLPQACKIYLLDNFDSFTYNLVDEFRQLGYPVVIYRNNVDAQYIRRQMDNEQQPVILVLSPGPGTPHNAGCLLSLINICKNRYPMLGICLGHQALVESFGGKIGLAPQTVHGKTSKIFHNGHAIFGQLPNNLQVARYHSLQAINIPPELEVIAQLDDIPMAVISEPYQVLGFQFHPESIMTTQGSTLIEQALQHLMPIRDETKKPTI